MVMLMHSHDSHREESVTWCQTAERVSGEVSVIEFDLKIFPDSILGTWYVVILSEGIGLEKRSCHCTHMIHIGRM